MERGDAHKQWGAARSIEARGRIKGNTGRAAPALAGMRRAGGGPRLEMIFKSFA